MADQRSNGKYTAQVVANVFVSQYYQLLKDQPELVYKFYSESSVVSWPAPESELEFKSATTLKEINELIMSSPYNDYAIQILSVDAQESLTDGRLVVVTGFYIGKNNLKKSFSQTFVLAGQDEKWSVRNDILRFVDIQVPSPVVDAVEEKTAIPSTVVDSGSADTSNQSSKISTETTKTVPEAAAAPAAPAAPSAAEVAPKTPGQVKPSVDKVASNVNDDNKKMSYASMLAKASPVNSPAAPKAQDVARDGVPRVSRPQSNGGKNYNRGNQGATGIYIRGLPYEIKEEELLDIIVKKFGPVKPKGIQIRKYPDGFCYGFAEFQTAESASKAVEAKTMEIGEKKNIELSYKKSYAGANNGNLRAAAGPRNENFRGGSQDGDRRRNDGHKYENRNDSRNQRANQRREEKKTEVVEVEEGWSIAGRGDRKK